MTRQVSETKTSKLAAPILRFTQKDNMRTLAELTDEQLEGLIKRAEALSESGAPIVAPMENYAVALRSVRELREENAQLRATILSNRETN